MPRSRNLQALTEDIKRRYPGVVIYGIGDEAHKLNVSDHNEDDTPGVRAAQSDSDSLREHRAIDVMVGPNFTKADADGLVARLSSDPSSRSRLFYIIWNGRIWSRSNNWVPKAFSGDPHRDHPHISGIAADDNNAASWPAVGGTSQEEDMGALDELVVIDQDIDNLSGGYVKVGQKIPLKRFLQLDFVTGHRDFSNGMAVRNAMTAMQAQIATVVTGVTELKQLLSEAGGDPDIAAFIAKLEEEANKTRVFAQELMDRDEEQEREHAAKMAAAWQASVVD